MARLNPNSQKKVKIEEVLAKIDELEQRIERLENTKPVETRPYIDNRRKVSGNEFICSGCHKKMSSNRQELRCPRCDIWMRRINE
jgi:rubrerythrin